MGQYDLLRSNPQCVPQDLTPSTIYIVDHITWHRLSTTLGTACAALALVVSVSHVLNHAFHCYVVSEQR